MKKDILYFEVINNDGGRGQVLGTVKFPLNKIEKQDEYDLELEIPDENDDTVIMAKINAKIQFIWSIYKYYQDLLTKSEKVIQNCGAMIQKTHKLLENLNEPMKFFDAVENRANPSDNTTRELNNPSQFAVGNENVKTSAKEYEMADKLENLIKTTFKRPNIPWMPFIRLLLISNIILGFINLFGRSNFLDVVAPLLILIIFYTTLQRNTIKFLNFFLMAVGGLVALDLIWMFFSASTYAGGSTLDGGNQNSLRRFIFLTSLLTLLVKIALGISIWIQKLKVERGQEDKTALLNYSGAGLNI